MRITRDPLLNKSNFISGAANASWHQEVLAAADRARGHIKHFLNGLLETENAEAEVLIVASGTAVAQSREALRDLRLAGINAGLIKIKSIRPFPYEELAAVTARAEKIVIPEFNANGWLAREVKAALDRNYRVTSGPRVFGGMSMPPELIVEAVRGHVRTP